jgi:hypothetical protein
MSGAQNLYRMTIVCMDPTRSKEGDEMKATLLSGGECAPQAVHLCE